MKRLTVLLVVVIALLLNVGVAGADGEYTWIKISALGVSEAIRPLKYRSDDRAWPDPGDLVAWCYVPDSYPGQKDCLQAIYLPNPEIIPLPRGSVVWVFERESWRWLCLRVLGTTFEVKEPLVLSMAGGDVFALIVPNPVSDRVAVVWARRSPKRSGLWR